MDTNPTITDPLDPARANALCIILGIDQNVVAQELPPFFHQIYFWDPKPNGALGRDGHPAVGQDGLIPDLGLPRRMWAGGQLRFHKPLVAGEPAQKTSSLESAEIKHGKRGPMGFVKLKHEIHQNGELCVTDLQDLVYLNDPDPSAPKVASLDAATDETICRTRSFTSTDLFRYSALTFNGHRIHYDLDYCRNVEGYDNLVVHGPLLAQTLMLLASDTFGSLSRFEFRAKSPVMCGETVSFCQKDEFLWVRGADGRLCVEATACA